MYCQPKHYGEEAENECLQEKKNWKLVERKEDEKKLKEKEWGEENHCSYQFISKEQNVIFTLIEPAKRVIRKQKQEDECKHQLQLWRMSKVPHMSSIYKALSWYLPQACDHSKYVTIVIPQEFQPGHICTKYKMGIIQLEIKISLLPTYFFGKLMTQMIGNFMGRKRRIRFKLKTKKLTQRVQELLENKKL